MNTIKKKLILLFISVFLFLITLNIFKPIFTAKNLIFPYSINKFDIITEYPLTWKYIKILYCITCFISIYLLTNSFQKYILIKKIKIPKKQKEEIIATDNKLNILLGFDEKNQNIYITEKSLYQNMLVTGTIGSR